MRTGRDDVALLGFTSGTTGAPKATMHFHRDILIIADGYARQVLEVRPDDVFVGSPPIAFTFGLGGLAVFPLRFGASAALIESATPPNLVKIIETYKATVCFTAPTAYRAMLSAMDAGPIFPRCAWRYPRARRLPAPVYEAWTKRTGVPILDGMGSTEMLHVFISNRLDDRKPGVTGKPVPGYEAKIVDEDFNEAPRGTVGRLAVRGPTGCRYLADVRQQEYVAEWLESDRRRFQPGRGRLFPFRRAQRRHDRFGRLQHRRPRGGGGAADARSGRRMRRDRRARRGARRRSSQAFVVLKPGVTPDDATALRLQNHVKATIAPYKYPRAVEFLRGPAEDADRQDPALPIESRLAMSDDLFERTRALFDLPKGVDLSRRQFARSDAQRRRGSGVRRELDESWGRELIRAWNTAGWIDLPARVGDQIGALIGAPEGSVMAGDSTSINLFKALTAALRTRGASQGHSFRQRQFPDRSLYRRRRLPPARPGP